MILVNKPEKKGQESGSPVFQELKAICVVLGMSKPPANITMMQFFSGIEKKVSGIITSTIKSLFKILQKQFCGTNFHRLFLFFFFLPAERSREPRPTSSRRRAFNEESPRTRAHGKLPVVPFNTNRMRRQVDALFSPPGENRGSKSSTDQ